MILTLCKKNIVLQNYVKLHCIEIQERLLLIGIIVMKISFLTFCNSSMHLHLQILKLFFMILNMESV